MTAILPLHSKYIRSTPMRTHAVLRVGTLGRLIRAARNSFSMTLLPCHVCPPHHSLPPLGKAKLYVTFCHNYTYSFSSRLRPAAADILVVYRPQASSIRLLPERGRRDDQRRQQPRHRHPLRRQRGRNTLLRLRRRDNVREAVPRRRACARHGRVQPGRRGTFVKQRDQGGIATRGRGGDRGPITGEGGRGAWGCELADRD